MANYKEQIQQLKEEHIQSVCEQISFNSDIRTSQIPRCVLTSCFTDQSSALRVFSHVLNLESNQEQKMQATLDNKTFSSLFENFKLVAEGTVYCRDFHLPREPFPIFRLENYDVPQLEKIGHVFVDYINFIKHHKEVEPQENDEKSLKFSIPFKPNHFFFMEYFVNNLDCFFDVPFPIEWVTIVMMTMVKDAVSNASEYRDAEKYIEVVAVQRSKKELELTISCVGALDQESNELHPLLPIDDEDLKKRGLYWIKKHAREIYFAGNGTEMTLTFSKFLR